MKYKILLSVFMFIILISLVYASTEGRVTFSSEANVVNINATGTNLNSTNFWDSLDTPANINLNDLGNVNAGSPNDDELLSWDVATAKWIPATLLSSIPADSINGTELSDTINLDANMNIIGGFNFSINTSNLFLDMNTGNIGIGTTSPGRKLDLEGTDSVYQEFHATDYTQWVIGSDVVGFAFYDDTNDTYRMIIDSSGNVGIGTTSPGAKLEVNGNTANTAGIILRESDDGQDAIQLISNNDYGYLRLLSGGGITTQINAGGVSYLNGGNVGIGTTAPSNTLEVAGDVNISGGSDLYVTDDAYFDGNVGIGTTSPGDKLEVQGNTALRGIVRIGDSGVTNGIITFEDSGTGIPNAEIYTNSDGDLKLRTSSTDRLVIDRTTGNVGINTTTPTHTLNVVGDLNVTGTSYLGDLIISADNITVNNILSKDGNISFFNSSGGEKVRINQDGDVGIGTVSPLDKLNIGAGGKLRVARSDDARWGLFYTDANAVTIETSNDPLLLKSANRITFEANGVERVRIATDGNVGIGTTTSSNKLEVAGDVNISGGSDLYVTDDAYFDGNVGIGTTTPLSVLQVQETNAATLIINSLSYTDGTSGFKLIQQTSGRADLQNTGNTAVSIAIDGKVGIGTTDPNESLHVIGNINVDGIEVPNGFTIQHESSAAATSELFIKSDANMEFTIDADSSTTDRTFRFFKDGGTELFRIQENGRVGIGTTTPSNLLEVAGDINISGGSDLYVTDDGYFDGDVGIGTTAPTSNIHVEEAGDGGTGGVYVHSTTARNNPMLYIHQTGTPGGNANTNQGLLIDMVGNSLGTARLLNVRENGVSRFLVRDGGNVGIGTTAPESLFHIFDGESAATVGAGSSLAIENSGDIDIRLLSPAGSTNTQNIIFGDADNGDIGRLRYNHVDDSMSFTTSATQQMTIDTSGNINMTNAQYILANSTSVDCTAGALYYDGTLNKHMGCNGTWNELY